MTADPVSTADINAPPSFAVTVATSMFSDAHTGWISAIDGIGRMDTEDVEPFSSVMRVGFNEYPISVSDTDGVPTIILASAETLPIAALMRAVPPLRGEKNIELP